MVQEVKFVLLIFSKTLCVINTVFLLVSVEVMWGWVILSEPWGETVLTQQQRQGVILFSIINTTKVLSSVNIPIFHSWVVLTCFFLFYMWCISQETHFKSFKVRKHINCKRNSTSLHHLCVLIPLCCGSCGSCGPRYYVSGFSAPFVNFLLTWQLRKNLEEISLNLPQKSPRTKTFTEVNDLSSKAYLALTQLLTSNESTTSQKSLTRKYKWSKENFNPKGQLHCAVKMSWKPIFKAVFSSVF